MFAIVGSSKAPQRTLVAETGFDIGGRSFSLDASAGPTSIL